MKKSILVILLAGITNITHSMAPNNLRHNLINTALHKYLEAHQPRTLEQVQMALRSIEHAPFSSQQNINKTRPSFSWQSPQLTLRLYKTWSGYELYSIIPGQYMNALYNQHPIILDSLGRPYKIIAPGVEAWPSKNGIVCKIILDNTEFAHRTQQFLYQPQRSTTKDKSQKAKGQSKKDKKKEIEIPRAKL